MKVRIHKVLADHGIGSRRGIESLIRQKKILVNGQLASIGQLVSDKDVFEVEGRMVRLSKKDPTNKRILMYNKKVGEISSRKDPDHKKTIFDTLPKLKSGRWVSVGRLDINSSGLMLFTNNGDIANKLMHPSSNIKRTYEVVIKGTFDRSKIQLSIDGIKIGNSEIGKFINVLTDNLSPNKFQITKIEIKEWHPYSENFSECIGSSLP